MTYLNGYAKEVGRHRPPRQHAGSRDHGPAALGALAPDVALCQHEDLVVSRFELLYAEPHASARRAPSRRHPARVARDRGAPARRSTRPTRGTSRRCTRTLHDFARAYPFDPDAEDYLVHITTGSHVAQICLFLLTESRHIPGRLVQTSPPQPHARHRAGRVSDHRPRPLEVRPHRDALRAGRARRAVAARSPGIETRNALQRAHRRGSIASRRARAAPILLLGPTGAGKSRWRGASTS